MELSIPEVDMALLKQVAKKFGWRVGQRKSRIEKGLEDIAAREVNKTKDAENMFKQILG